MSSPPEKKYRFFWTIRMMMIRDRSGLILFIGTHKEREAVATGPLHNHAELPARNVRLENQLRRAFSVSTHAPMRDEVFSDSLLSSSASPQNMPSSAAADELCP